MNIWEIFKPILLVILILGVLIFGIIVYGYASYQKHISLPIQLPEKTIALTFDDGPVPATNKILDLLKELNVPATFFVLGDEADKHPNILTRIHTDGHAIGNHSYNHPHYIGLRSKDFILSQMEKTNKIIKQTTGKESKLFRSPFGESSFYSDSLATSIGMKSFLWTMSTVDWNPKTTPSILNTRLKDIHASQIILMHDRIYGEEVYLQVLKENIIRLQKEGFRFVTLDQV